MTRPDFSALSPIPEGTTGTDLLCAQVTRLEFLVGGIIMHLHDGGQTELAAWLAWELVRLRLYDTDAPGWGIIPALARLVADKAEDGEMRAAFPHRSFTIPIPEGDP